jgi:enamine deaminase RidA (YjgF/YER057c/UK114 family)
MNRSIHVAAGLFDSGPYGFAQVAVIRMPFGDVVNVSGQVAWDADRKIVGAGDIGRQLEKSLEI